MSPERLERLERLEPLRRVSVVGMGGKTALARELAARLAVPRVELDALFWGHGWKPVAPEEFRRRVERATDAPAWVVDGNYSSIARDIVWARADTVVWLDYPLPLVLWRLLGRIRRRIRTGDELWPGTGNRETIRNAFLQRDPLFLFVARTHRGRRRGLEQALSLPEHARLARHRFRRPADAERWLESLQP